MKKALIISLSPNIGHLAHVEAYCRLFVDIGYESLAYINKECTGFISDKVSAVTKLDYKDKYDVALVYSPHKRNLLEILRLKKYSKSKILFVFHEPVVSFDEYKASGYTRLQVMIERAKNWIFFFFFKISNVVLLPSQKAWSNFQNSSFYSNNNSHYFPLIFCDQRDPSLLNCKREYFSYIGTVASDHSFKEFLEFVRWAVNGNKIPSMKFLIATKSEFDVPDDLKGSERVKISKGKPMTDNEINHHYASTYVVWNAYERLTQSGVLAKAFMFGTPAIVMRKNLSEFTEDGQEVKAIDDNRNFKEIESAVETIVGNFERFSISSRERFENSFYYKCYNDQMRKIIENLK